MASFADFARAARKTSADYKLEEFKMSSDAEPPKVYFSLIDRLEKVAEGVEGAPRNGDLDDEPEGAVQVAMSLTFAEGLARLLREAAAQLKRPY